MIKKEQKNTATRRFVAHAKRCCGAFVLSGLMLALTGCGSDKPPRTAGETIDDQAIGRRVQEALGADPAYKFPDVKVTAYEGKVQLSGFVDRDEQKGQAEQIARKVPGVKDVQNQIVKK